MIFEAFVLILFIGYGGLFLFYYRGWRCQPPYSLPKGVAPQTMVTVIIPARNEAPNLPGCLQSVLNNEYPKDLLEIIVIDDFSTDDTGMIAQRLIGDRGSVLFLDNYLSAEERVNAFKKKALSIAVSEAKGQLIVTTDADCIVPPSWITTIVAAYETTNAKFVVAPVSYKRKNEPALLFYFQSLDFMTMQGITAAAAALKGGNMCNGANLAFDKSIFFKVGGYTGIDQIASGDDMLLMNKIQKSYPDTIFYLKSKEAIVTTTAQRSWRHFFNQRIRWASKTGYYNDWKVTMILFIVYFFNLALLLLFIIALLNSKFLLVFCGIVIGKIIVELILLIPVSKFFNKTDELKFFPFLQPLHILYIIISGFLGKFGTYEWKGRKVK